MADSLEPKKRLVFSIIEFLREEVKQSHLTEEKKESVEVAIQCLEMAYDLSSVKPNEIEPMNLYSLITEQIKITDQLKLEAEEWKKNGNEAMKADKYQEALKCYTRAIEKNPYNAVYYCNRAAVYSKLDRQQETIKDCQEAIKLEPQYSKAYSRLGIAYTNLNRFEEAYEAYKIALKFDPTNQAYESNLKLAEEKLQQQATASGVGSQLPLDINQFINNPALIGMATQMLENPSFRNVMSGLINSNNLDSPNLEALLQAGQTLASRLNEVDPNFTQNLRRTMHQNQNDEPADQEDKKKD